MVIEESSWEYPNECIRIIRQTFEVLENRIKTDNMELEKMEWENMAEGRKEMTRKNYIMRKINKEKIATTEERRAALEEKGYTCIGVTDSGEQEEKASTGKREKKEKTKEAEKEGSEDGGRADNAGKD